MMYSWVRSSKSEKDLGRNPVKPTGKERPGTPPLPPPPPPKQGGKT